MKRQESILFTSNVMGKKARIRSLTEVNCKIRIRNTARETVFLSRCYDYVQGGGGARLTGHIQIEGNEEQLRQTINDIEARSESKTMIVTGLKFPLAENSAG
jgi:hypothetical protein